MYLFLFQAINISFCFSVFHYILVYLSFIAYEFICLSSHTSLSVFHRIRVYLSFISYEFICLSSHTSLSVFHRIRVYLSFISYEFICLSSHTSLSVSVFVSVHAYISYKSVSIYVYWFQSYMFFFVSVFYPIYPSTPDFFFCLCLCHINIS